MPRLPRNAARRTPARTWRGVPSARSSEIHDLLVKAGSTEDDAAGTGEMWRVRLGKAVFTGYRTGTIYCSGADEPELAFTYERIESLVRHR